MKNKYEDLKRKPRKTILQSLDFSSISLRFVLSFEQMNVIVFKLSCSTLEQYSSLQPPPPMTNLNASIMSAKTETNRHIHKRFI